MSEELTKDEIADVYSSLMSVAHSVGAIYGTPTKTLNKVLRHWTQCSKELTAVTEQRDAITLRLGNTQVRMFNAEMHRDSLAEEIRKHKETLPFAPQPCDKKLYEALQSLTPNEKRIHGGAGQPNQPETPTPLDGVSC
jgi:hypothetical protein